MKMKNKTKKTPGSPSPTHKWTQISGLGQTKHQNRRITELEQTDRNTER